MRARRLVIVAACLAVVGWGSDVAAESFAPIQYSNLRWRMIGPFRGGRTVAATGVPGSRTCSTSVSTTAACGNQ